MKIFAVYDVKAESFGTPFFMQSTGLATRAFADLVNDSQTTVFRHPGDFKLVEIGEFDERTGAIGAVTHVSYGFGTEYKESGNVP